MKEPSIFTKIINREIPSTIRYEDDDFIAINDIKPMAPVHVLLIPKREEETLEEISLDEDAFHTKLLQTARRVAQKLGIADNYKIMMNVGKQIQLVHHIHMHILGGWEQTKQASEIDSETSL
jgi:histidine triad (HIT) family protein